MGTNTQLTHSVLVGTALACAGARKSTSRARQDQSAKNAANVENISLWLKHKRRFVLMFVILN